MKQLTLALLLSVAPATIVANDENKCGNSCDRTEQVTQQDERCCGLAELVMIDALQAYEATSGYITASKQTMSTDGWNFVTELLTSAFGTPATQTDESLSFAFARGDMDLFQWFETLAAVETKVLEVQSIIENDPKCIGGNFEFGLND